MLCTLLIIIMMKKSGSGSMAGLSNSSQSLDEIERFRQLWKNSDEPTLLTIPFISRAIDEGDDGCALNPTTTGIPSCTTQDALVAVAIAFGTHGRNVPATEWNLLFSQTESENVLRESLLKLIFDAYRIEHERGLQRGDNNDGTIPKYKDICRRVGWICAPDTKRRHFFARYLVKLCDAICGRHSAYSRMHTLGLGIVRLGKLTAHFQHPKTWQTCLVLPENVKPFFKGTTYLIYDSEDDDSDNDDSDKDDQDHDGADDTAAEGETLKLREERLQNALRTLAEFQADFHKFKDDNATHVNSSSQLLQDVNDIKQTLATLALNVVASNNNTQDMNQQERLGNDAMGSTSVKKNGVALRETLGTEITGKVMELAYVSWSFLCRNPKPVNGETLAKEFVKAMGFSEERLWFRGYVDDGSCQTSYIGTACTETCQALSGNDEDSKVSTTSSNKGKRKREIIVSSDAAEVVEDEEAAAESDVVNPAKRDKK